MQKCLVACVIRTQIFGAMSESADH